MRLCVLTAVKAVGALFLVFVWASGLFAQDPLLRLPDPWPSGRASEKNTVIQAQPGYMWGFNEIWFRDGDNANIRPSKKVITLNSPTLGIGGERFLMSDLSVRVQGLINLPTQWRNDFLVDRPDQPVNRALAWDTRGRCLFGDISLVYYLGLTNTPYRAGFVAGYRYYDLDYNSTRSLEPVGTFQDHLQTHVPYTGVYYADSGFMGSVMRLDILWSAITLARLDSERNLDRTVMRIDGHALTGFWFESFFEWILPVTSRFLVGLTVRYNFVELSGGATIKSGPSSTRFSMDSRLNIIFTGLSVTYSF